VGSKWTFPISMADCIPRTFLIGLGSVEKFFDWKELSEVCEGEIPEHGSCLNLVGSSPSKA